MEEELPHPKKGVFRKIIETSMGVNQEHKSMDDAQLEKLEQLNPIASINFSFVK